VISVHGHDVYGAGSQMPAVRPALRHARLVLANSAGTARRSVEHGARATRVVHLGTDVSAEPPAAPLTPTLVTVGHLVPRKRHEDVIRALALLSERYPLLLYEIVGEGPERERLVTLARSVGVSDRVLFRGQLAPADAAHAAQSGSVFVLPSVDEAFGVAYIEAMAGGVPAIGCRGEDGPAEIAATDGGGITLVPPRDPPALARAIDDLLSDEHRRRAEGSAARATVEHAFTWAQTGAATVAAYEAALNQP
jgi:teichuronic acid biosynthesis glycosyltransferase TuaC